LETLGKLAFSDSTIFCSAITFFQTLGDIATVICAHILLGDHELTAANSSVLLGK
jgi:hypothetical protein